MQEIAHEIAVEGYAEKAAELAEAEANRFWKQDLGGANPAKAPLANATNRCANCGDFTVDAEKRGGVCLHCARNPDAIVDGKPRAMLEYNKREKLKHDQLAKLQIAYAETPLSLEATALQVVFDEAKDAGVGIMYIDFARGKLTKLEEKAAAHAKLQASWPRPPGAREERGGCRWVVG